MTRVRDRSTVVMVTQDSYAMTNGVVTASQSSPPFSLSQYDRMTDVVTPGFRKEVQAGRIVINGMSRFKTSSSAVFCPWWRKRVVGATTYYNYDSRQAHSGSDDNVWSRPEVVDEVSRLEALAVTEAYARVGEADVESLVELAELRETLGFLWSPVRKITDVTLRFRKYLAKYKRWELAEKAKDLAFERRQARYATKKLPPRKKGKPPTVRLGRLKASDISSAWLAYRYAIMPLIYTFQDVQGHLARTLYPERVTSRAKESSDFPLEYNASWLSAGGPYGNIQYRHRRVGTAKITSRAGVLYTADWGLDRQLGFQLHQVPAALYEAIPLSFVADWFWTGSRAYQALTATLRSNKILGSWVKTRIDFDYQVILEARSTTSDTTCHPGGQTMSVSGWWEGRRKTSLQDIRVQRKVDLNAKRIADALALIHTFLATARKK